MQPEHYPCRFRLGRADHYVIWFTNGRDGLVCEGGFVATFTSLEALLAYARGRGWEVDAETLSTCDWDAVQRWCEAPFAAEVDPVLLLHAWNTAVDVLAQEDREGLFWRTQRRANDLYDKLFFAHNLPAVTPPGQEFMPAWESTERVALAELLRLGLDEVRRALGLTEHGDGGAEGA